MKVFLSYAKEDKEKVLECYTLLKSKFFEPWMDEHDLLPGQNWDECLKSNMTDSDVVLAFLSKNSVTKTGYVQRELKYFLDKRKDFPTNFIYLIPILLDDCKVPQEVAREIQFININGSFNNLQWERVLRSLLLAKEQRNINALNQQSNDAFHITTLEKKESFFNKTGYEFYASYPEILANTNRAAFNEINRIIHNNIYWDLINIRSRMLDQPLFENEDYRPYIEEHSLNLSLSIQSINANSISILNSFATYTGGAHGNHGFSTMHFVIKEEKAIRISPFRIFKEDQMQNALNFIKSFCIEDLIAQKQFRNSTQEADQIDEWVITGCDAIPEKQDSMILTKNTLTIYFSPYEVDCYAAGDWKVEIPLYKMSKWIDRDSYVYQSIIDLHNGT